MFQPSQTPGVVRGWDNIVEYTIVLNITKDSGSSASNLWQIGSFMHRGLHKGHRAIQAIKERDHTTLLDS